MDKIDAINAEKHNNLYITPVKVADTSTHWKELFNNGEAGIDTVWAIIPVNIAEINPDSPLWNPKLTTHDSNGEIKKLEGIHRRDYGNVMVKLFKNRAKARLQFNAARLESPKSPKLLGPLELSPLMSDLLDELRDSFHASFDYWDSRTGALVRNPMWEEFVSFTRLDFARNMDIDDPMAMRKALAVTKPRYGKTAHMYWDFAGGWTFEAQTRSAGSDRIYDKAAELDRSMVDEALSVTEGLYRFETQLQGARLKSLGERKISLKTLSDITESNVAYALERRWAALNWSVTIAAPHSLDRALAPLGWKQQDEMLGFLRRSHNGDTSVYTKSQISRLRKRAKELGLQPGLPLEDGGIPTRKLDLLAGGFIDLTPQSDKFTPSDV